MNGISMTVTKSLAALSVLALVSAELAGAQDSARTQAATQAEGAAPSRRHAAVSDPITGTFEGAEGRRASGSYRILTQHGVQELILSDDFSVQDEPNMWIVLSPAPYLPRVGQRGVYLGKLRHLTGAQRFRIPKSVDIRYFSYVLVWCRKFGMPVGQADLAVGLDELNE